MSASTRVRPAAGEDLPAIAAMAAEFHAYLAALDGSDPEFDVTRAAAALDLAAFGPRPLCAALIAEVDGAPVGYAVYNIGFWANTLETRLLLTDLCVREARRGQGVARQLIQGLAEVGRREGCAKIIWTVWSRNAQAMRFYAGLGAVLLDDEHLMKWAL